MNAKTYPNHHAVILIHGIRTYASWQERAKEYFESDYSVKVFIIKYGYFDLFSFLLPFKFLRKHASEKIKRDILKIRNANPDYTYSMIAHSFGAYNICELLLTSPEMRENINALILCGAVVRDDYPWHIIREKITGGGIRNDYSKLDPWPSLARSASIGYGAIGTYGAHDVDVSDVKHEGAHSDYFSENVFVAWKEFILSGKIIEPNKKDSPRDGWASWLGEMFFSLISFFKWIMPIVIIVLATWGFHSVFTENIKALEGEWESRIDWAPEYSKVLFGVDSKNVVEPNSVGNIFIFFDSYTDKWKGFSTWTLRSALNEYARLAVLLGSFNIDDQAKTLSFDLETAFREKRKEFDYGPYSKYKMRLEMKREGLYEGDMIIIEKGTEKVVGTAKIEKG